MLRAEGVVGTNFFNSGLKDRQLAAVETQIDESHKLPQRFEVFETSVSKHEAHYSNWKGVVRGGRGEGGHDRERENKTTRDADKVEDATIF